MNDIDDVSTYEHMALKINKKKLVV